MRLHALVRKAFCARAMRLAVVMVALVWTIAVPHAWADQSHLDIADGAYLVDVALEGGSGRAYVTSPTRLVVDHGQATATVEWSSPHYDYMLVDGQRYTPTNDGGNSTFEIPVPAFDEPIAVVADTTAMSTPHEIAYELTFDASSLQPSKEGSSGAVETILPLAAAVATGAGVAIVLAIRRR